MPEPSAVYGCRLASLRAFRGYTEDEAELAAWAADEIERLRDALITMRELAGVAHNGDPWYAENEGIDAGAIFKQAREALGKEQTS